MSSTVTAKQKSEYYYIKCVLEDETSGSVKCNIMEPVKLQILIVNAVKQLHGSTGAAITVDVLKCDKINGENILRVTASNLIKLWSSLTLLNSYNGKPCRFNVKQVSPYLMSLASDSRTWSPVENKSSQSRYYNES